MHHETARQRYVDCDVKHLFSKVSWVFFKAYLVSKYGASAFVIFRQVSGDGISFKYTSWWEIPAETYISAFAIGASIAYIIKCITTRGYWKKLSIAFPFFVFFIAYLFLHEASVGPRRLIILLAMIALVTMAHKAHKSLLGYLYCRWKSILLVLIVVFSFSFYYQAMRSNFHDPLIMENLLTKNPLKFAAGVGRFLQPSAEISGTTKFFRDGPIHILYRVIEARGEGNPGTEGEIIKESILGIIPRILIGQQKRFVHADEIFEREMSITPNGPYIKSDIATNILAIFIADFGVLAIFIPPFLILGCMVLFTWLQRQVNILGVPPWSLFWISMMFGISSTVEADLGSVLVTLRNATSIVVIIIFVFIVVSILRPTQLRSPTNSGRPLDPSKNVLP